MPAARVWTPPKFGPRRGRERPPRDLNVSRRPFLFPNRGVRSNFIYGLGPLILLRPCGMGRRGVAGLDVDEEFERAGLLDAQEELHVDRLAVAESREVYEADGHRGVPPAARGLRRRLLDRRSAHVNGAAVNCDDDVVRAS